MGKGGEGGETTHRRGVRPAVVVDHDDQALRLGHRDVVERFVGHAPGEGAVPDDGDGVPGIAGEGMTEGIGEGGRRVTVLDEIVIGLLAARVAR